MEGSVLGFRSSRRLEHNGVETPLSISPHGIDMFELNPWSDLIHLGSGRLSIRSLRGYSREPSCNAWMGCNLCKEFNVQKDVEYIDTTERYCPRCARYAK